MATGEYRQIEWDDALADDCRRLIRLAVQEDLQRQQDWTTVALIPSGTQGAATVGARQEGVVAGLQAAELLLAEYDPSIVFETRLHDGAALSPGLAIARLSGPARSLLVAERPFLNLLGHLSGIASLTRKYVDAVSATKARIYDTRKTMPGWRGLEKLAVRAGGGVNHRLGLYDGVLIKDNHLALGAKALGGVGYSPAEAVRRARTFLAEAPADDPRHGLPVEVEVDSLAQLEQVLPVLPDIVLLDNMNCETLTQAVALRDRLAPAVILEASGGVHLQTVANVARTGVDRISVGNLTHSAPWLDVGLDWE